MQFTNILVSLLLSSVVAAHPGAASHEHSQSKAAKNGTMSVKATCKSIASMEAWVALAANTTKLATKTKDNATKIAEVQSKASSASAALATLTTNSTLMSDCAVIAAADKTDAQCSEMNSLQKLISLASNDTKLATKTKGNETKIADIKAMASTASTKLATLTSNATLEAACSSIASEKAAKKAGNNDTRADKSSTTASGATTSSTSTSAANTLAAVSGVLSTIAVVAVGMMALA